MAALVSGMMKMVVGGNTYDALQESKAWCVEGSRSRSKSEWRSKCDLARKELGGCNRMVVVAALVSGVANTILGGIIIGLIALGSVLGLALIEDCQDLVRKVRGLHMGTETDLTNNLYNAKTMADRVSLMTADCLLLNKVGPEFLMNMAAFVGMGSADTPSASWGSFFSVVKSAV